MAFKSQLVQTACVFRGRSPLCSVLIDLIRDNESDDSDDDEDSPEKFAFPDLDAKIRAAIEEYGGVFPKLNFSAPKVPSSEITSSTLY